MMKTVIQHADFPAGRRILMVSDIHGYATGLRTLLHEAHFCEDDILVIVGDLIEKGPENLETLRYMMDLCRHYTVYPLMGNVDIWRLNMLLSDDEVLQQKLLRYSLKAQKWWNTSFLGELLQEIGLKLTPDLNTKSAFAQLQKHFAKEFSFIQNLPTILETQKMIFVHGGIPHENLDALRDVDGFTLLKRDCFYESGLSFNKYVVVGHWPVLLYCPHIPCADPIIDKQRRIISLDGGMGIKENGQLNLVVMDDYQAESFSILSWDGLPEITALEDQAASTESFYLHWAREPVTVTPLTQEGDMTRILYQQRELLVPTQLLSEKDGITTCDDVTDYHLPVSTGDTLKLIYANNYGCYAKKGSVTGWYRGAYKKHTRW